MTGTARCDVLEPDRQDAATAAFSREVTRIHARTFGSVPGTVEVTWEDDFLICTLGGTLTEAERSLLDRGRFDRVREDRRALHDALGPTYKALVETLTGRAVRAHLSEVDEKGIAFEAFILGR